MNFDNICEDFLKVIEKLFEGFSKPFVTAIVPAYNEGKRIKNVISILKRSKVDEIIVVDDGSKDDTYEAAKKLDVKVIRHSINKGKGAAIKTGIHNAKGDILLFIDADLKNITPQTVDSITEPIRTNQADFVKTCFSRARGRVTEMVIKPLFKVVSPLIDFKQPLSGQFAVRKDIIDGIVIDDRWGVDVQILLNLIKKEVRIQEVDIGWIEHKKQPIKSLVNMSEQVIRTVLAEKGIIAKKHKLILFDFDKTLIEQSSIEIAAKEFGFEKKLAELRKKYEKGIIKDYDITVELAKEFKGKREEDFERIVEKIKIRENADKVIDMLKNKMYEVGVVSLAYSVIVRAVAKKIGIPLKNIVAPILRKDSEGRYTGKVRAKVKMDKNCCDKFICKSRGAKYLMDQFNVKKEECIAVGDGKSDACLFKACGLSLVYGTDYNLGYKRIKSFGDILIYAD